MVSIAILLVVIIFLVILVGGLVWAVREDYKDENKHRAANKKKFEIFLEVAKGMNKAFSISPIITGSLGLCRVIGDFKEAEDIDVWIPKEFVDTRWSETITFMKGLGFELKDEHEHEFSRQGEIVAFGPDIDLAAQAKINTDDLNVSEIDGAKFKEFTAQQYLDIYKLMLRDNYRQEKKGKKDQQKIDLIEAYIKANNNGY